MHPDWQSIQKILLVWSCDVYDAIAPLEVVCSCIQAALPQVDIWLLVSSSGGYQLSHLRDAEFSLEASCVDALSLIALLRDRSFEAAVTLTRPDQSPYEMAYLCYLANIPIRVGQSVEFGGGVLSLPIQPPLEILSSIEYQMHLLKTAGILNDQMPRSASQSTLISPLCV